MTFNCGNSITKVRLSLGAGLHITMGLTLIGWLPEEWYVAIVAFRRAGLSLIGWHPRGKAVSDWLAFRRAGLSLMAGIQRQGCL